MFSAARPTACRSLQSRAFLSLCLALSAAPPPATAAAPDDRPSRQHARSAHRVERPEGLTYATESLVLGQGYAGEVEPNNTPGTATPIAGTSAVIRAGISPALDRDVFSFGASAGDRVYVATMTAFSPASTNSVVELLGADGVTVIQVDDEAGTFTSNASVIGGATLPAAGTYFIRVTDVGTSPTSQERPYELHFRLQSGAPTPEIESNDTPATANLVPANGWVSGTRDTTADVDVFRLDLAAGDTVSLILDLDPEQDLVAWNGRLGLGLFGDAADQVVRADDPGAGDDRPAEALMFTVRTAGTYFAYVDAASAADGGPTATYALSITVHPTTDEGLHCTTYTSTDVPKALGPGAGVVSSTLVVPGNRRIADLDVRLVLNHTAMADVDARLVSPAGNENGLFTDIGAVTQTQMDAILDDEAGIPPSLPILRDVQIKPEPAHRLGWYDGENAGGVWTLVLHDDTSNAGGGTLTAWGIRVCEPPPPPACAPGFAPVTVFSTDFESGAAGFIHAGVADEWELGLPATGATGGANPVAGFNSCHSGVNCWKTDLDNTYNLSSQQDLLSPLIDLTGLQPPVVVTWAQRYQMENATFDHLFVDARAVSFGPTVRLFEWQDGTMAGIFGSPATTAGASSGWSLLSRRADGLAGLATQLRFHLDSDDLINLGGLAVDDVSVTACAPAVTADLSITKTDNVTSVTPNQNLSYFITASNAGPAPVVGAAFSDTLPSELNCTGWSCSGTGGGTCFIGGSGTILAINDTVGLPVGASVNYIVSCQVASTAVGPISNTATISIGAADPNPSNNSATDLDTVTGADVAITKTDGVTQVAPGQTVTYTITATNLGPSDAPVATVSDIFGSMSCNWTCTGAGGGVCTPSGGGGGIFDTVSLPVLGTVTYTAACSIPPNFPNPTISNTATVSSAFVDPSPGNNSATDTDTVVPVADIRVTKTNDTDVVVPGQPTTYVVRARNFGPSAAPAVTVQDVFPLSCNWTCSGFLGATCTPSGSGDILDTVAMPLNSSVTYTAVCDVPVSFPTGPISNTATASSSIADPDAANNSATDTDTVATTFADLQAFMTDGVTVAVPGQTVTYTIMAGNAGPDPAPSATVVDTFPAALACSWTCNGVGASCTASGTGDINDVVSLPVLGNVTYTAVCQIDPSATGTLANTVTISSPTADPFLSNNSSTDTDTLTPIPADLSITKTDGVTTAVPGQSVTYTIVAANAGPEPAPSATVTDTFPASLTCNWSCAGAGGGTCTASGSGDVGDAVSLPAGGSVTYTASCLVDPGATGTLSNTATVSAPVTDVNQANNVAADVDTLTPLSDLSITKTDGVTQVVPGLGTTYTITAANAGPSHAPVATVTDVFPAPLLCSWFCAPTGGSTCTHDGPGDIADPVSLPAGSSVTYTAFCSIAESATGGPLSNTANVVGAHTDPNPGNESATDIDALVGETELSLAMTVDDPTPAVGSDVTYTLALRNEGPSEAHSVVVTDRLPPGLTFVSAAPSLGTYSPGTGAWTIGALGAQNPTLSLVATVGTTQTIVNQAAITSHDWPDPNRGNNSALVAINGPGLADVRVDQSVDDLTPASGQNVSFVVVAWNGGPSAATAVVVTDNLPAGLTFVSASPSQGTYSETTGTWTVGNLDSGTAAFLGVAMTATSTSPITRVVQKTQAEPDLASANDTDSVTLNDPTAADLAMGLVASQEPVPQGTTFTYTIVASNHGPATATNVTVNDSLPAGLTFVSATASQGSCAGTANVACGLGTLADGQSAVVQIVVTNTAGGPVSNTATVSADQADPFMANNSNSETSTPAELTGFRVE